VSELLYHFAWDEVFDWYVELAKVVLSRPGGAADRTGVVLGHVLDALLRLLHPVMPFVTEALWTALTGGDSVVVADWPRPAADRRDPAAEAEIAQLQQVVTEVRRFRADQGVKPGQRVPARLELAGSPLAAHEDAIRTLARLDTPADGLSATATLPVAGIRVELDLSGAIDVGAERTRLGRDLAAAEKELAQARAKLGNHQFLTKAPDAVVDKIRRREAAAAEDIARLREQLAALAPR
jgi:valyl-tRNA synthetase